VPAYACGVLARDLAAPYPTVTLDTDALTAARLLTEFNRPGLIVVDERQHPVAVLPGSQVLRVMIPTYVQEDAALARVLDEDFADSMCAALSAHTVRELVPKDRPVLPIANDDDTVLEIAAMMAANRSPLVAVLDGKGKNAALLGAISIVDLLGNVLPEADKS
jgi:CBS domain-containing protein